MSDKLFVERTFKSGDVIVTARFLQPSPAPDGEYQCHWEILWPGHVQSRYANGIDGIQALMLAMKSVHSELMESDLYKSGMLTYLDGHDLDLPPGWGDSQLYVPPEQEGR